MSAVGASIEESQMIQKPNLDCIVIGYNEIPFQRYESFLRNYGEDTEASPLC